MKNTILGLLLVSMFLGCVHTPKKLDNDEIYKEIFVKINEININDKKNKSIRTVVRESSYKLVQTDNKQSARKKALVLVKADILDEMLRVMSRFLEVQTWDMDKHSRKVFNKELSLALKKVVKVKVMKEKFAKKVYYVKASTTIDPQALTLTIASLSKFKANESEIKSVHLLLDLHRKARTFQTKKLKDLQVKLTRQSLLNKAQKKEIHLSKMKLKSAEKEAIALKKEYAEIKKVVTTAMNRLKIQAKKACLIKTGMSKRKVLKAIGKPNTHNGPDQYTTIYDAKITKWNYGTVSLEFTHSLMGTVKAIIGCQLKSK